MRLRTSESKLAAPAIVPHGAVRVQSPALAPPIVTNRTRESATHAPLASWQTPPGHCASAVQSGAASGAESGDASRAASVIGPGPSGDVTGPPQATRAATMTGAPRKIVVIARWTGTTPPRGGFTSPTRA